MNEEFQHPEQREGEIYLGNYKPYDLAPAPCKSWRVGIQPYDIYGNPILDPDYNRFPVFVEEQEWHELHLPPKLTMSKEEVEAYDAKNPRRITNTNQPQRE